MAVTSVSSDIKTPGSQVLQRWRHFHKSKTGCQDKNVGNVGNVVLCGMAGRGEMAGERYAKRCGEIKAKAPVAAQSGQIYRRNLRA
jgi:hypothetical protein